MRTITATALGFIFFLETKERRSRWLITCLCGLLELSPRMLPLVREYFEVSHRRSLRLSWLIFKMKKLVISIAQVLHMRPWTMPSSKPGTELSNEEVIVVFSFRSQHKALFSQYSSEYGFYIVTRFLPTHPSTESMNLGKQWKPFPWEPIFSPASLPSLLLPNCPLPSFHFQPVTFLPRLFHITLLLSPLPYLETPLSLNSNICSVK